MTNEPRPAHPELLSRFARWWKQNETGGWACRWRRRPVWFAQLVQKLGWEREVRAPMFWGGSMQVITNETTSRGLLTFGYAEPTITALMLVLLQPGDRMVDVGTHFGYEALLGCELVGKAGSVIGFEPSPEVYRMAVGNLRDRPQARIKRLAVADHEGVARFQMRPIAQSAFGGIGGGEGAGTFEVEVRSLDVCLAARDRPVNFLKCDAEGYEMAVLRGADGILKTDRPFLVLEADMPGADGKVSARAHELAAYLQPYEYTAYNFDFDGAFRFGALDAFPVSHANVAFLPDERADLLDAVGLATTRPARA